MIPALALRHWKLLASGLVLALLLAWGFYWKGQAGQWKHTAQDCQAKSKLAAEANARAKAQQELAYKQRAEKADERYQQGLEAANDRVAEYIRTHRVRTVYRSAPEASSGSGAIVPPEMSATGVVVSEEDVRACNDAIEYAWAAHGWAATLNTPIVAVP
jgi:hypothetical protein